MKSLTKSRQIDMLHGSIWNKIPLFALPVAATAILGQLFNASDLAIVGSFSDSESTVAVAAVGANSAIINLTVNLFIGIALGVSVVIAHAIGHNDKAAVEKAVHTSIIVALLGGFCIMIIGELAAAPLLGLMNLPEEVFPYALLYLRIYLLGMPVILLYNFESAIFRSIGQTRTPLLILAASGILNVVLNIFFVVVLHMTVNGVAIATVISNCVSSAVLYIKLIKTDEVIHVDTKKLHIDKSSLRQILRIGVPAGIQTSVFSIANIVIQSSINSLGTIVMAGSSAAYNMEAITYSILNSFSQACTTFTGQNFGAGDLKRCKKTLVLCLGEGLLVLAVVIITFLNFGRPILSIFNNDPAVIDAGLIRLQMLMIGHIFCLMYDVMSGYLRGFGISLPPAVITMLGVCVLRIIWTQFVFPLNRTFWTIMLIYPISLATTAVLMFVALMYFRPGKKFASGNKS